MWDRNFDIVVLFQKIEIQRFETFLVFAGNPCGHYTRKLLKEERLRVKVLVSWVLVTYPWLLPV